MNIFAHGRVVAAHCVGIILLYLCQGLVQGTLGVLGLAFVHANKDFSLETIGLLGLPHYFFSIKFVWAPIVDLWWVRLPRWMGGYRPPLTGRRGSNGPADLEGDTLLGGGAGTGPSTASSSSASSGHRTVTISNPATSSSKPPHAKGLPHHHHHKPSHPTGTGFTHRRMQWALLTQLCMCLGYVCLYDYSVSEVATPGTDGSGSGADDGPLMRSVWALIAANQYPVTALLAILGAMAFVNATQDVAVDAWAVEGLPSALTHAAGTLQMIGLTFGISLSTLFLSFHTRDAAAYPISFYFAASGVACAVGMVVAVAIAAIAPLHSIQTASDGSIPEVRRFLATPSVRDVMIFLLTRGVAFGAGSLCSVELIRLNWVTTADASSLSFATTIVQLLAATFVTPIALKYYGTPMRVLQHTTAWSLAMQAVHAAFFLVVGSWHLEATADQQVTYYWLMMVPSAVFSGVVGSITFVCVAAQFAAEAALFPNVTGTAVTVLNSIANLGFALPSSAVMLSTGFWTRLFGIDHVTFATIMCVGLLGVGTVLRYTLLLPAVYRLERQASQRGK